MSRRPLSERVDLFQSEEGALDAESLEFVFTSINSTSCVQPEAICLGNRSGFDCKACKIRLHNKEIARYLRRNIMKFNNKMQIKILTAMLKDKEKT